MTLPGHPESSERSTVDLTVNRQRRAVHIDPGEALVTTLRERLDLRSVRQTCSIGICGTCTVLLDGNPVNACLLLTDMVGGQDITTAEGLVEGDRLSAVQQAFVDAEAFQCSFCIPAMALAVHSLCADLDEPPSTADVREYLSGNLCRCGSYPQILEAVAQLLTDDQHQTPSQSG